MHSTEPLAMLQDNSVASRFSTRHVGGCNWDMRVSHVVYEPLYERRNLKPEPYKGFCLIRDF